MLRNAQTGAYAFPVPPQFAKLPTGHYAAHPYDAVRKDGALVGLSTYPSYSANERAWITLAMVRPDFAETGTQLSIHWGEANGGSAKPQVERHRQIEISATVQPWPIHGVSRRDYRSQS